MNAGERQGPRFLVPCLGLLLVLAVGVLYGQTARHDFVSYDDQAYITQNPHVSGGLSWAGLWWACAHFRSSNWHPLTWLSHQLDVELFGLAAGPHHLVSAGLHALSAVLCFLFFRRATGRVGASFLTALLFAVHPQRVESVAWASERKDVLSGAFFFATLLAYERHARAPSRGRLGLVTLLLALGLCAKPMLVTVPFVLLLCDLWPLRRFERGRPGANAVPLVREKLPLFALALASCVVTLVAQRSGGAVQSIAALALAERGATAVLGTLDYLQKALWPAGLAFFYPHPALVAPETFGPLGWKVLLGALALVALTAGAWRVRGRFPCLFVGWLWFLGMLVPVIGLVQVGMQFAADRYAYLPLLGPTFAVVFLAAENLRGTSARLACGAGLAAAAAFALVTHRQVGTWRDSRTLCEHALAVTERNHVAHEHLGLFLQNQGDAEGARAQYLAALAIEPRTPSTHGNLGAIYAQEGKHAEAVAEFEAALRLVPEHLEARMSYGLLLEREGDLAGAAEHYRIAAREHPGEVPPWQRLGAVEAARGRPAEALEAYGHVLALEGGTAELFAALGEAEGERGDARAALARFDAAERYMPGFSRALHGRAWIHATSQDPEQRDAARALTVLERCRAADGASWTHLRVQAAALAAAGRFEEAVLAAAQASAAAPRSEWERLKAERETYQARRALER